MTSGSKLRILVAMTLLLQNSLPARAFDLGSTEKTTPANLNGIGSISVIVGGKPQLIKQGDLITPAVSAAIQQVLTGGRQSLVISGAGNATGGTLNFGNLTPQSLNGLALPQGVTAINDFGKNAIVNVLGALNNSGNIYAFSSNAAVTTAVLNAQDIINNKTGVISSITPKQFLPPFSVARLNLDVRSAGDVLNEGIISSSGNLLVTTGSGTVKGAGTMQALTGSIEVKTNAPTLTMIGGDYLSQSLNIDVGSGIVNAGIGNVSGWVNINAGCAAFGAMTQDLKLGALNVTGDPTYYNVGTAGSGGNIHLASVPGTNGQALAILASGDVTIDGGTLDTTDSGGGNGGSLTIIAGAQFLLPLTGSANNDSSTTVTLTQSALANHGSLSGGSIDISGVTSINTNGTMTLNSTDFDGGNVTLVAFAGSTAGSGVINAGTTGSITTTGCGPTGTNGNILVVAGAVANPNTGSAITLPAMFTGWSPMNSQSGGGGGGSITISTATPNFSSNISILNGAIQGGSGTISGGTLQPTSVTVGALGGSTGTITMDSSLTGWQIEAANYALGQINAFRASNLGGNKPPLTLSPVLMKTAIAQAEYLAQTQHFDHITLNGAQPGDRAVAQGVNIGATGFAENVAYAFGYVAADTPHTAKSVFDLTNQQMIDEGQPPPGFINHFSNLTTHSFIGIGFAEVGGTIYVVENFTDNNPNSAVAPNPVVPTYGGVYGGAGLVANDSANKTIASVGSSGVLPTSMNTAGANVNLTAGNAINVAGAILANGKSATLQDGTAGKNGGSVNINAVTDITLYGIQAAGGFGGAAVHFPPAPAFSATAGGNGGAVSVTSQTGNISILPGAPCSPCLSVSASGGAGGQVLMDVGTPGGNGGHAGNVSLSAPAGNISLTAVDAGGGGGAGGYGGAPGGAGGAGGAGGTINLTAGKIIDVQYYINASGGGGGGAGGQSATGGAGGGGGGASLAMAGGGGTSSGTAAGGGGGGMSELPGFGGTIASFVNGASDSNGENGTTGQGGTQGLFGGGGGGGHGTTALEDGGAGGGLGQAGSQNGAGGGIAGNGGAGGTVTVQAGALIVDNDVSTFWAPRFTVAHGSASILALGSNGTVSIDTTGVAASSLDPNANYASNVRNVPANLTSTFSVGSFSSGGGTQGSIEAGPPANSISINGSNNLASPLTTGDFTQAGSGSATIIENVNVQVTYNTGDLVTPAEWAAIVQVTTLGGQTVELGLDGVPTGGTITVTPALTPSGGFDSLIVPPALTLIDNSPALAYSTSVQIDGIFDASIQPGAATLSTPQLIVNGTIIPSGGGLSIQGTGPSNALSLNLGANANINLGGGTINAGTLTINSSANNAILDTNVAHLNITSPSGTVSIRNAGNVILDFVNATNLNISTLPDGSSISTAGNITASGILNLTTSHLVINNIVQAAQLQLVSNNTTGDFTIDGTGTLTSTVMTSIIPTFGNLAFASTANLTLNGLTNITANGAGQSVVLPAGAVIQNNGTLNIQTSLFNGNPGQISGNQPVILSSVGKGTIANPNGDVALPSGFTFSGANLAILASGDIRTATGAGSSINLSSTTADGGTLTLIAGYDFTGPTADPLFKTPNAGAFLIGAPSASGGSVLLPKTSINVGTSKAGKTAGSVLILAHSGATNSGLISIGAIKANAPAGTAGNITLIGGGGIHTGALNASGITGGTIRLIGAQPIIPAGSMTIANGTATTSSPITNAPVSQTNGAAIYVNGAITSNGTKATAGNILLQSDAQIDVIGKITANGMRTSAGQAGGNVDVSALSTVNLKGGVSTSALTALSSTVTGDAGSITINGGSLISTGALSARGANNTGTGAAGFGGAVTIATTQILVGGNPFADGTVKTGTIDTRGGNAAATTGTDGGDGGAVSIDAGAMIVNGSINASGGLPSKTGTTGNGATITLHTYALQPLSTNFDLTSTKRAIAAIPGALFTVGSGGAANGVTGTIKTGTQLKGGGIVVDKTVNGNGRITSTSGTIGPIAVTVTGSTALLNGNPISAFDPATGKRTLVTAAESAALFGTSRGNAQSINLDTTTGAAISGNFDVTALDLNSVNFSAFNLPAAVTMNIQGVRPMLNLPNTSTIQGDINFTTAGSIDFINALSSKLNIAAGASISTPATLIIYGTRGTWTNSGTLQAAQLVFARPSTAALTFITASGASTIGNLIVAPAADVGMTMTIKSLNAATFNMPVVFGNMPMPAIYTKGAQAEAGNASRARTVSLTFDMTSGTPTVQGNVKAGTIKLTALNATPLLVGDDTVLNAAKGITLQTASGLLQVGDSVNFTAGALTASAPSWSSAALIGTKQIASAGAITLKSNGGINVGSSGSFISNGANLSFTATSGNIVIASANLFRAMAGNIVMLAAGTVTGANGNSFQAKATDKAANGGIEIGSGLTTGTLASAFAKPGGTQSNTAPLGAITINQTGGALVVNSASQGTFSFSSPSSITINKGAVVFDSIKSGQSAVTFGQTTFETKGFKPIAHIQPETDFVVDVDSDY